MEPSQNLVRFLPFPHPNFLMLPEKLAHHFHIQMRKLQRGLVKRVYFSSFSLVGGLVGTMANDIGYQCRWLIG